MSKDAEVRRPSSGGLQGCLVDEEGAAREASRRRRMSLAVSVGLQAALVGVVLLVPLVVNGERIEATIIEPAPPYYSPRPAPQPVPPGGQQSGSRRPTTIYSQTIFQPSQVPPTVQMLNEEPAAPLPGAIPAGPGDPTGQIPFLGPGGRNTWNPPLPEPPKPAPSHRPQFISDIDPARLLHRVEPVYPYIAKVMRLQGKVVLRAVIARDGTMREVELLSGHPVLAEAAMKAVGQWRYQPTLLNGQPVEVETHITVIFILQ